MRTALAQMFYLHMPNQTLVVSPPVARAAQLRRFRPAVARDIRTAAGVTQGEIATELGVTGMTVSRWECGHAVPRKATLERYLALLDDLQQASA